MLACLFGVEGKEKNKNKNLDLPTYQPNVKAAKLLWKQAATALLSDQ